MEAKLQELKARLQEIADVQAAGAVLAWDQRTYMPPGGAEARGRQLSTLRRLSHDKFTDPALGSLLDALLPYEESLPFDSDDASLLRVTRRQYERATKVPSEFVSRSNSHASASYSVWQEARPANDFARVQPYLEKTVEYSREYSDFFPGYAHIADPLLDPIHTGLTAAQISALFAELRAQLVPLAQAIAAQPALDDACLTQFFPEAEQIAFARQVVERFGYDFSRGRLDKTAHPFEIRFSSGDVRITTRVKENDLGESLFSILHEAGHAMYEQGVAPVLDGTPSGRGASSDVHESQSRLWENVVGRSRACWNYWYPHLQAAFPQQLGAVPLETFYRAINKVTPSLIRTEADEVTYNLHVMIRFDLELALLEGQLAVRDLPAAWRERYTADLGVTPPDDRDGVLQDVHWYSGGVGGAFHCYTLGNILCAQFYQSAIRARPSIPDEIARGEYDGLRGWLTEHVYRHGRKFTMSELVERATGGPLSITPYMEYLRGKYGALYGV